MGFSIYITVTGLSQSCYKLVITLLIKQPNHHMTLFIQQPCCLLYIYNLIYCVQGVWLHKLQASKFYSTHLNHHAIN